MSDNDDSRIFSSLGLDTTRQILRLKHNDDSIQGGFLRLHNAMLDDRGWERLGEILGQNEHIEELYIFSCNMNVAVFGAAFGYQNNQSLDDLLLENIDLGSAEKIDGLAPFFNLKQLCT